MPRPQRGLETLACIKPLVKARVERAAANALVLRPHPKREGAICRVGINSTGNARLYYAHKEEPRPNDWTDVGACPKTVFTKIILETNSIELRQGPGRAYLFYYRDDD